MCVFFRISVAVFFSSATKKTLGSVETEKGQVGAGGGLDLSNFSRQLATHIFFGNFHSWGNHPKLTSIFFKWVGFDHQLVFFFQAPKQLCGRLCWSAVSCGFAAPVQFLRQLRTQQLDNDTQFWSQVEFQKIAKTKTQLCANSYSFRQITPFFAYFQSYR